MIPILRFSRLILNLRMRGFKQRISFFTSHLPIQATINKPNCYLQVTAYIIDMENTAHLGNLPRKIIEMILQYLSSQPYANQAQLQLINNNWRHPAQAQLYSSIDFTCDSLNMTNGRWSSFLKRSPMRPLHRESL